MAGTSGLRWLVVGWALTVALVAKAAEFTVTPQIERPAAEVVPLGANHYGRVGAIEWAANNFIHNSGNEPIYWKNMHRVKNCGDNWFEIDGPDTSWFDLWGSGFLSGADVRIYRLVDKDGNSLPIKGAYLDIDKADHPVLVGTTKVIPAGIPGYPDGGWIVGRYSRVHMQGSIRYGNLSTTDTGGVEGGRTYYYAVVAVNQDDVESDLSNDASADVGAAPPQAPHILIHTKDDLLPQLDAGKPFEFMPKLVGGTAPYQWSVTSLPLGLQMDPATGKITGQSAAVVKDGRFALHVKDSKGQEDQRWYVLNPSPLEGDKSKPLPPTELTATADGLAATLTWKASPSANVAYYRIKRSPLPRDKQVNRVYVVDGSPKLETYDYIVLEKKFDPFEMKLVNSRVRGVGNPMNSPSWFWNTDSTDDVSLQIVSYQQKPPAEMADPGEGYLEATAKAGKHVIKQTVFIGTDHGKESQWYGQLEPGKHYRAEFWLRQDGLGDDGKVVFSYGIGYSEIHKEFAVTGDWQKYIYDFVGPERPKDTWHFGHQLEFTGPGKLDLDNARIFRVDDPADGNKPYVPNATVFNEFMASQPASGPKGAHRVWFLNHNATMSSLLSWHANSRVAPDWITAVSDTMEMTLPMALMFDERTGKTPEERVRPWIVIQHILHTEQDWQNFVEYLSAPYDPAKDSPQTKPWAYRRYQQRGNPTPWTDEFAQIIIEFGNETWHNGHFADWLGFAMYNQVTAGGREYGLFTRYLIDNLKKSPYWASQNLDKKVRFNLGAFYNGKVEKNGKITGYGEDAMKTNPLADLLGHANYVGPKWETGQAAATVYNDDGVQTTLLGYVQGLEPTMQRWSDAHSAMAKEFHAYDLGAYEGGPSGYTIPGKGQTDVVEVNEKYGKSLAMAVAALDCWLSSYKYGYTYQCFLAYGQGSYWNSHTDFAEGFRPSPGWLALTLRNRYAAGDLMAIDAKDVPTIKRGAGEYPLLGCYAMRDGKTWNVFVLSRQLDGALPVTIQLPITKASKITLHKLAGDPRLTNRDRMNITIQSAEIDSAAFAQGKLAIGPASGGVADGMPAGSIYLYSIEGD